MKKIIIKLLVIAFFISGCGSTAPLSSQTASPAFDEQSSYSTINLTVVGDIMVHDTQIAAAYDRENDTYNFDDSFAEVKKYLSESDLTIGNLETTLAGEKSKYTGYPKFNAPESLATALKDIGFDVLITANNHAYDRKEEGVINTIYNLRAAGLENVGTYLSQEDRETPWLKEINGLKVALLAYTYGINGLILPPGKSYLVNLLNLEVIVEDIKKAKKMGAEIIICYLHFGVEYESLPNSVQKEVVRKLFQAGGDIILGSHPHVLQPGEFIPEDGNKLVIYSLGNFISSQKGLERQSGAIYNLQLTKNRQTGEIFISEVNFVPVYTQRYLKNKKLSFIVLPLEQTLKNRSHAFLNENDYLILEKAWRYTVLLLSSSPRISIYREKNDL